MEGPGVAMVDLQNPKAPIPSLLKSKAIGTLTCHPTAHPWDQLFLPPAVRELRTPPLPFSGGFPLRSRLRASLPDPAHSSHPVAGDSIPIEKVTGIPAWRYAGEADQADKTVLPGGVTWTGEIISIVYRILPKWCSILCGWATYYSVHHIVISVRCKNSGISLSTQMILSNL